jgi:hypothetical protein
VECDDGRPDDGRDGWAHGDGPALTGSAVVDGVSVRVTVCGSAIAHWPTNPVLVQLTELVVVGPVMVATAVHVLLLEEVSKEIWPL